MSAVSAESDLVIVVVAEELAAESDLAEVEDSLDRLEVAAECDCELDEEVAAERDLAEVAAESDPAEVAAESELDEVATESELDHQASSRLHEVAAARKLQKDVAAALKPLSHRETVICRICEKVIK